MTLIKSRKAEVNRGKAPQERPVRARTLTKRRRRDLRWRSRHLEVSPVSEKWPAKLGSDKATWRRSRRAKVAGSSSQSRLREHFWEASLPEITIKEVLILLWGSKSLKWQNWWRIRQNLPYPQHLCDFRGCKRRKSIEEDWWLSRNHWLADRLMTCSSWIEKRCSGQ